jgi:hypothetical protein
LPTGTSPVFIASQPPPSSTMGTSRPPGAGDGLEPVRTRGMPPPRRRCSGTP